jgi:uncharacterized membrane protein YfbV (UPF0208 family)
VPGLMEVILTSAAILFAVTLILAAIYYLKHIAFSTLIPEMERRRDIKLKIKRSGPIIVKLKNCNTEKERWAEVIEHNKTKRKQTAKDTSIFEKDCHRASSFK